MATNLQIDDRLIAQAVQLGRHKTKREAVNQALLQYNRHLQQLRMLSLFGKVDFDPDYDYKVQRQKS